MTPAGAVPEATDKKLAYQGRKASRAKSEHRRRLILEAALRIVIREGVRGIRHRAVAKEADVPLAATTYYFKDIQELIVDAFTLYTEKALGVVNRFTEQLYQPLQALAGKDLFSLTQGGEVSQQAVESVVDYMVQQLAGYVREQIVSERDMLVVEQAFRYEAVVNTRIRELALMHRKALFEKVEEFLQLVKSPAPAEDAEVVMGIFHSLEYASLLNDGNDGEDFDIERTSAILKRYFMLLVPNLIGQR